LRKDDKFGSGQTPSRSRELHIREPAAGSSAAPARPACLQSGGSTPPSPETAGAQTPRRPTPPQAFVYPPPSRPLRLYQIPDDDFPTPMPSPEELDYSRCEGTFSSPTVLRRFRREDTSPGDSQPQQSRVHPVHANRSPNAYASEDDLLCKGYQANVPDNHAQEKSNVHASSYNSPFSARGHEYEYHDYVNFSPLWLKESAARNSVKKTKVPDYQSPPDYAYHRYRKPGSRTRTGSNEVLNSNVTLEEILKNDHLKVPPGPAFGFKTYASDTDSSSCRISPSIDRKSSANSSPVGNLEIPKTEPPPYNGHHEILNTSPSPNASPQVPNFVILPVETNVSQCDASVTSVNPMSHFNRSSRNTGDDSKSKNGSQSSYRKNVTTLVRRASSGANIIKKKAPRLRSSFHTEIDFGEKPSILERLCKERPYRRGGSKSTGHIPTSTPTDGRFPSDDRICSGSTAHLKSSENLKQELSSFANRLSTDAWVISENQAVKDHHNRLAVSTPSGSCQQVCSIDSIGSENTKTPISVDKLNDVNVESVGDDISFSDDDNSYDTLIIKDVSDLSDRRSTDESFSL